MEESDRRSQPLRGVPLEARITRRIQAGRWVAIGAIIATLTGVAHAGPVEFGLDAYFEAFDVGENPQHVAIADLNGDGRSDLVTANMSGSITILIGQGHGIFGLRTDVAFDQAPFGNPATCVEAGDLNGDGALDLVVECGGVQVLMNTGHGAFTPPVRAATISSNGLAVGDLNHDSKLDIVAPGILDNLIGVLLGRGDGSFDPIVYYPAPTFAFTAAVGDLNGDGHSDIAAAIYDSPGTLSILLNLGNGTFGPHSEIPVSTGPRALVACDLNGDGHVDLAAGCTKASVLINRGDGTFLPHVDYATRGGGALCAADLNGDGALDLVLGGGNNYISILMNRGNGTFESDRDVSAGDDPLGVAVGLLDDDATPDIAVTDQHPNGISVLHGKGDGTFGQQRTFGVVNGGFTLDSGDLDADGVPDVVTGNQYTGTFSVLLGDGSGGFLPHQDYFSAYQGQPRHAAMGDLDEDGRVDIAVASDNRSVFGVHRGLGGGALAPVYEVSAKSAPYSIALGDLNEDGHLDVVMGCLDSSWILVSIGHGDGSFDASRVVPPGYFAYRAPSDLRLADMNRDGHLDIVAVTEGSASVVVVPGLGDGTFGTRAMYAVGSGPRAVAVGDLNGDDWLDVVATVSGTGLMAVLLNQGDGTLGAPTQYFVGSFPESFVLADLDHDDLLDVAAVSLGGDRVVIRFGQGDGTLAGVRYFGCGRQPFGLVAGDLNRDGMPELIALDGGYDLTGFHAQVSRLSVLTNRTGQVAVATAPALAWARVEGAHVSLGWQCPDRNQTPCTVYRRTTGTEWKSVGAARDDGFGRLSFDDDDVRGGTTYWYRLGAVRAGVEQLTAETRVDVAQVGFAMRSEATPSRAMTVRFTLPSSRPIRIDVIDTTGRRVVSRQGEWAAGTHVMNLAKRGELAPGVYYVRLEQGSRSIATKSVIVD